MALTFSKKLSDRMGRKRFKIYEVTNDESTLSITAASLDLNYIDYALLDNLGPLSSDAARYNYMSVTTGIGIGMSDVLSTGSVNILRVWGY